MSDRPKALSSKTDSIRTGYGIIYITITERVPGKPYEIFAHIEKSNQTIKAKAEAICRLISLCLRNGVETKEVIKALIGIRGGYPIYIEDRMINSIPDALAQVLRHNYEQPTEESGTDRSPYNAD